MREWDCSSSGCGLGTGGQDNVYTGVKEGGTDVGGSASAGQVISKDEEVRMIRQIQTGNRRGWG